LQDNDERAYKAGEKARKAEKRAFADDGVLSKTMKCLNGNLLDKAIHYHT
jgi:hypothetical protein